MTVKCEICGREFEKVLGLSRHIAHAIKNDNVRHNGITVREYYDKYIKIDENEGICPTCGSETDFKSMGRGYSKYCPNRKCLRMSKETINKRKQTNLEKYGVENPLSNKEVQEKRKQTMVRRYGVEISIQNKEIKDKIKKTNIERYGVDNPGKSKQVQEKMKKTNIERHGVENVFMIDSFQEKRKKSMIKKYGAEYPIQNKEIKNKIKKTNIDRYGVENPLQNKEIKDKIKKTNLERYGTEFGLSSEEVRKKIEQTNTDRYGVKSTLSVPEVQEKIRQTNIKRYGVEYPIQNKEIKDKIKKTNLERYGVDNVFMSDKIKKRIKEINLERYGIEYPAKNKEIYDKVRKTNMKRYGVRNYSQSNEYKEKIQKYWFNRLMSNKTILSKVEPLFTIDDFDGFSDGQEYTFKCKKCDSIFNGRITNGLIPRCYTCYPSHGTSIGEREISEFCEQYTEVINNSRSILEDGKEIDIFLPEFNIGIEFDGLYWHSEYIINKDYHLNKTLNALAVGINLIHIFEDEWYSKSEIIKSMLLYRMGKIENRIYGRKCEIREVSKKDEITFLDNNHISGYVGSKIAIGLYYEDELISIMTFGKSRFNKKYNYELIRFCNKLFTTVIGGASKLFKYFISNYSIYSIISYCNMRFSTDGFYSKIGFDLIDISRPNYFYVNSSNIRESRIKYQKHKLKDKLETFDNKLTEYENMQLNGYYRIYDCGNLVYTWEK